MSGERTPKYFGLQLIELPREVRAEVEKPLFQKLERAHQLFKLWTSERAYVSCSFGKDSMIVLFLALQHKKDIPVAFLNTGIEYPESLKFKDRIVKEWDLNYYELKSPTTFWKIMDTVKARGQQIDDGSKDKNICCYHLKEKPFLIWVRQMHFTVNFTGITAMESRKRAWNACQKGQEYYVKKQEVTKVHPILYWKPSEVSSFIKANNIPVNPVYEKYRIPRIGCMCCASYKGWREQLARINPKMYKFIMERYFDQLTF